MPFRTPPLGRLVLLALLPQLASCAAAAAQGQAAPSIYPTMAPIDRYLMTSAAEEIALARTAAPPSVSAHAEVLVLGRHGYDVVVKGDNGWVCYVERSWFAGFTNSEFWNPKNRSPSCFNPPAARSVLPQYLTRTTWVLAGATPQQILEKARAAYASHQFTAPEPGSLSLMLSKLGYLGDEAGGPWYPHAMPFVPHGQAATWGAGFDGSPILDGGLGPYEPNVIFIPVRRWSDGSPGPPVTELHQHV